MLSIHGVHEWQVVPGLQDTGGQNVFVNQLSGALEKQGYKVTIVNRGGYPHPRTGDLQKGIHYHGCHQRILYLDDGRSIFVRKEDMGEQIPGLAQSLTGLITEEDLPIDLIISHYWDAAILGCIIKRELELDVKHVWVPHSLGQIKKRNLSSEDWANLRIQDRIGHENTIIEEIDFIAATSSNIVETSKEDYGFDGPFLWIPPCVDQERYYPRQVNRTDPIWEYLSSITNLPIEEIQDRKIITEISRTDKTKQKDILIRSFANILPDHPKTLLIIAIDVQNTELGHELIELVHSSGAGHSIAAVGSVWDSLPVIYAISDIYCTPSIMEGFGMSVQEAAATKVPVISSNLVPFVTEYLINDENQNAILDNSANINIGEGAIVVQPGDIAGFTAALDKLLSDEPLRQSMGERAYQATISYFTWDHIVKDFINGLSHTND